ncbi:MAG: hypothetical protein A2Y34_16455 [Spirochaetes bacterium GWC1_27_15]|nr:MAG: hypothetical protein A2Z98_10195 [Spirochaetes bacterium GWB1_27_13]OHD21386.1 MAG: hypothetical protein A2Y34_16455 [Spirochaetes bacterium GWC1_27_15]
MELIRNNYKITLDKNRIIFIGKIEECSYEEISNFLLQLDNNIKEDEIILDLILLKFLNSAGIRVLATFFLRNSRKVIIKINKNITWQNVGITPLIKLKSDGKIEILAEGD